MFACFSSSTFTWSVSVLLLFKRCYHSSHKNVFQTFSFSNPNYRNLLTNPGSLSGVNTKCVPESKVLSFKNTYNVILKTNLLSFSYAFVCLKFPTSSFSCFSLWILQGFDKSILPNFLIFYFWSKTIIIDVGPMFLAFSVLETVSGSLRQRLKRKNFRLDW